MAHIVLNPEISKGDASSVIDCPDTLQDLCVFYLMNNIDILVQSLNKTQDTNEEFTSLFSLLHANRMLGYYSKCCIPCDHELPYIVQLMEKCHQCDEISVTTTSPLTNILMFADSCKSVRRLDLTIFDNDLQLSAYSELLENNLPHLTSLKLSQKCEELCTVGFLNMLGGKDFDADIIVPDSSDDNDNNDDDNDNDDDGDNDATAAAAADDKQGATCDFKKTEGYSAKKTDLQKGNLDTETVTDTETVESEDKQSENVSDKVISNLKSFSYLQIDSNAHPNFEPCRSFGWFYALLSRVISCNQHLQSFKLVTIISNPIEWFLSQPDLPRLKDLQSLCLSLEYFDDYVADSDEIKMPYTDKFFTNLPVLQNLRHLDISCSVPMEYFMSSMFSYSEQTVEMFIEALKVMPRLKSLDISGTNLATIICHTDKEDQKWCIGHCMPGFEGRRFDFLGLYGTDACKHKFIPADRVSGTASIEQLVEALKSLQHNRMLMSVVIKDISKWIKEHSVGSTAGLALVDGLIMYMTQSGEWTGGGASEEFEEKSICMALEIMFSLVVDHGLAECFTVRRKRLLLDQLLNICNMMCTRILWNISATWITEQRTKIFEKSMLLIRHLGLEHTAMYSYRFKQYVQVLLGIFHSPVGQTEKLWYGNLPLDLLYSVCKNNLEYKVVAGRKLEIVKILLKEIKEKASSAFVPKIWNILWTLTEGVPCNCELFVQNEGLQVSRTCIDKYSDDKPLRVVIFATLVNVSENPGLITWLMTSDMISILKKLLSYENEEDFGVSFKAADFLIILASYGPEAWTMVKPSRDEILEKIDQVMHKWDINKPIGRKIRWSLPTVLSHLDSYSTPVVQYWAAWLICNSVIVSPQRYCEMLQSGDGLAKIDRMIQHGGLRDDIVILLEKIRTLTVEYKEQR